MEESGTNDLDVICDSSEAEKKNKEKNKIALSEEIKKYIKMFKKINKGALLAVSKNNAKGSKHNLVKNTQTNPYTD